MKNIDIRITNTIIMCHHHILKSHELVDLLEKRLNSSLEDDAALIALRTVNFLASWMRRKWAPDFLSAEMKPAFYRFCDSLQNVSSSSWAKEEKIQNDFKILSILLRSIFKKKVYFC
jgi:hypothetical protein